MALLGCCRGNGRSVPTSLAIAGAETRTGFRTGMDVTRDSLKVKPFRATGDAIRGSMKAGVGIPLRGAGRVISGSKGGRIMRGRSGNHHHHHHRK